MGPALMKSGLILVRHAPVADRYRGLCYGQSDVELGPIGEGRSRELVESLAAVPVNRVMHSGLLRTWFLAQHLGERLGLPAHRCDALRERDFGRWELRPWDELHREHGDAMLKVVSEPGAYRPGGGETTFEMRDRVPEWFRKLPREGLTIAVTHGGPIAALLGTLRQLPVAAWLDLIPPCGECVQIELKRVV